VERLGRAMSGRAARLEASAAALSGANEVLGALALLAAVGATRAGWIGGPSDGATLLSFAIAFFLAYRPVRELADARVSLARAESAYMAIRAAMARVPSAVNEAVPRPRDAAAPWPLGKLELRGVSLARGGVGPLSLSVEPGEIVALAGPTGIGKTTLLRTLLGLEAPAAGEIVFDGAPLDGAPAGPSARPFVWVPQDAPLLADTLAANVTLGASVASPKDALAPLGAGRLADELEGARLGAGGRPVSGGERQWIALARAIATQQPVLLMDEPTTGLDRDAEAKVLEGIARLKGSRSVLLVTHRAEPLAIADRVVRLA